MKFIVGIFTCLLSSGCSLIQPSLPSQPEVVKAPIQSAPLPKQNKVEFNYAHYYVTIKSMTQTALVKEIELVKNQPQQSISNIVKRALLHSLPNSPIRNPYSAKSELNKLTNEANIITITPGNAAFLSFFKDLLNQQLLQLIQHNKTSTSQQNTIKQQNQTIKKLDTELKLLEEKIMQLKKIENNINKRG